MSFTFQNDYGMRLPFEVSCLPGQLFDQDLMGNDFLGHGIKNSRQLYAGSLLCTWFYLIFLCNQIAKVRSLQSVDQLFLGIAPDGFDRAILVEMAASIAPHAFV